MNNNIIIVIFKNTEYIQPDNQINLIVFKHKY